MSSQDRSGKPVDDANAASGRSNPLVWNQFPSIKIIRQAKGKYSPQADERCITYCSQSVRGRFEQREPWCRTFCLRRVFAHEVQRAIAAHDGQKNPAQARYPLPPEGQNIPSLTHVLIGESPESQQEADAHQQQEDVRYWEEGYYVWFSKSRWATQEKLDLMMTSIERQAQWDKYKRDRTEAWQQQQQKQQVRNDSGRAEQSSKGDARGAEPLKGGSDPRVSAPALARRPFPDMTGQSILLAVPPPFPSIWEQIDNLLAPTHKVLALTQETIQSGDQLKFAHRIWEKALTKEPFVLAHNVCTRMWDKWKKGPPDDNA